MNESADALMPCCHRPVSLNECAYI
jgi:hypothetical protein